MDGCIRAAGTCVVSNDAAGYGILAVAAVLLVMAALSIRDLFRPACPSKQIRRADAGTDGWISGDGLGGDGGCDGGD